MSHESIFATFTPREEAFVQIIVQRTLRMYEDLQLPAPEAFTVRMDVAAVHKTYPLRLEELATADRENFAHDMAGIARHIDRRTGQLGGCFVPRFARGGK